MKSALILLLIITGLLLFLNCKAKNPGFKNTKWCYVEKIFVCDVGTTTETTSLEFGTGEDLVFRVAWFTPAHPATYMKEDGTVEVIPASSGEQVYKGTWQYRRRKLFVTLEDGRQKVFKHAGDVLVLNEPGAPAREFKKEE